MFHIDIFFDQMFHIDIKYHCGSKSTENWICKIILVESELNIKLFIYIYYLDTFTKKLIKKIHSQNKSILKFEQ